MSEWSRSGAGSLPHDEASTREHFEEVGEDVRREREANEVARAHPKRPWWRFWGTRSS